MKVRNETGSENSSNRSDDQDNKETEVIATLDEASNADDVENYNDDGKNEEKQVENNPNTNDEEVLMIEKTIVRLLPPYKAGRQAKLSKIQLSLQS